MWKNIVKGILVLLLVATLFGAFDGIAFSDSVSAGPSGVSASAIEGTQFGVVASAAAATCPDGLPGC